MSRKIIITGFPHCGTTILKSIIGHIEDVEEIDDERTEAVLYSKSTDKPYLMCKHPRADPKFFGEDYEDYIKIIIIRNPLFVFSSINKRFANAIPRHQRDRPTIAKYISIVKRFIKYRDKPEKDIYTIKYEDLFKKEYQALKIMLDDIGLNYDDTIFDNTKYTNVSHSGVKLPVKKPKDKDHEELRTWQVNQPFVSNNDISKIDLSEIQKQRLVNDPHILDLYPDMKLPRVALVCIAKNEDHYIQEWVDYHTTLGFDDIWIYQNEWRAEGVIGENVHLVELDGKASKLQPILERPQMKAYNHFINSNKRNYDWACFIDVDEFLVLKKHDSIKNFIQCYSSYDSIAVNWHLFGDNGHEKVSKGNYSVVERFTKRGRVTDKHVKTMVKLSKNPVYKNPHFSNLKWVDTNLHTNHGPFNPNGPDDVAQINHYFCKTRGEFAHKISRGRACDGRPRDAGPDYLLHNQNEVEDLTIARRFIKARVVR